MQTSIRLLGTLLVIVALSGLVVRAAGGRSTREKIAMHKAWLAKRSQTKSIHTTSHDPHSTGKSTEDSIDKINYLRKLAKFKESQDPRYSSSTPNPGLNDVILSEPSTEIIPATTITVSTPSPSPAITTTIPSLTQHSTSIASSPEIHGSQNTTLVASSNVTHHRLHKHRRKTHHAMLGAWGKWSPCSRSCGGGVTSQQRHCFTRHTSANSTVERRPSHNCIGLQKRFRVCNEQSCPETDGDFREMQCSQFNNLTFAGKQYTWEAYVKDDAECELNCKPTDMDLFAMLQDRVTDGTPCSRPVHLVRPAAVGEPERRAICVDGLCKAIHSGGVIAGTYMNDGAVRCGHLLCKPVSGVFSDNPLQEGYSLVATIPRGASNISVTELKHSSNRLALRITDEPFFVNGDESDETQSGIYNAADAVFDYRRIGGDEDVEWKRNVVTEWITSTGPISHPIDIMVLAFDRNPGIKFEYLVPVVPTNEHIPPTSDEYSYESSETDMDVTEPSSNEILNKHTLKSSRIQTTSTSTTTTTTTVAPSTPAVKPRRKRRFLWKVVDFTTCSKSCGGGVQTPIIKCVRESPLRVFQPKRCEHLTRPEVSENVMRCNTQPCPGYWKIGEWSKCDCKDSHRQSVIQHRDVKCVQELGTGMVMQIPGAACAEERPTTQQKCECRPSKSSIRKPRPISMIADQAAGKIRRPKATVKPMEKRDQGVWLTSDWSGQCTMGCGSDAIEHRTVFCDRATKLTERCDLSVTPESARQCESVVPCEAAEWLVGIWGKCSGDCFNLTQTRTVQCVQSGTFVEAETCSGKERPASLKRCEVTDVSYCADRWHYSQWSECSKKCGGGTQRRSIKCVKPIGQEMRESDGCRFMHRQPAYQQCNTDDCDAVTTTTEYVPEARVDLIQNDIAQPDCIDRLTSCAAAKNDYLCNYAYFQQHCCHSCSQPTNNSI